MSEESLPVWNLMRTAHVVGLRFGEVFAATDLTPTQFAVLILLEDDDGPTQAELARRVLVRPQSVGALITTLVERGLVVRDGPGGRGRRAGIALTDAGRAAVARAWPSVRAFNSAATLGLSPAQSAMLDEILDRVRRTMEEGD